MKHPPIQSTGLAILFGALFTTPALAVINIDYVSVGNAGNSADPGTGNLYGAVSYAYQIAKNETTIGQYAEFLNAVAKTDTYGLYSTSMTTSYINGISRSGSSGSFTYAVASGSGNKPITFVSWFDVARFCNWMQNGQQIGDGAALTAETGAYTLNGATSGIISKNAGATVWIPSESEWYKAAYYDPNKGGVGVGGYWAQATQSNGINSNTIGTANAANCYDGVDYFGYPGMSLTDVGAYGEYSDSFYGTNDQAGNVFEWNDTVISGSSRRLRGGSWSSRGLDGYLSSSYYINVVPSNEYVDVGFRVASVPEPTSVILTTFASGMLMIRRKR